MFLSAWLVAARAGATTYKVQNPSQPVSGVTVALHVNLDCWLGSYSNGGNNRAPTPTRAMPMQWYLLDNALWATRGS